MKERAQLDYACRLNTFHEFRVGSYARSGADQTFVVLFALTIVRQEFGDVDEVVLVRVLLSVRGEDLHRGQPHDKQKYAKHFTGGQRSDRSAFNEIRTDSQSNVPRSAYKHS